jgi:hypothetical protein
MFCTTRLNFGRTVGVGSRFLVLRSRTRYRRYGGRRVPFLRFARPDSFLAETRMSGPIFKLCAPRVISRGTVGIGSRFHVLRTRTRFQLYHGHRVPFSCFAHPDSFSAVQRASGLVFACCVPGLIFGGTEGDGSRFEVLRARTYFRQCRGRRVPFSCFALPNTFSMVRRASGPVFIFCAPGLIFSGNKCVGSRFQVLRS